MILEIQKRLLILEDNDAFRKSLVVEFTERGYEVFEAAQVNTARRAIEGGCRFDFALLDMRIGRELGVQFIPELLENNSKCRVVVLTGYPTIATAVGAIKAGAVNYILKPSSIEIIEQALWLKDVTANFDFEANDQFANRLDQYEFELMEFVLLQCDWNVTKAAKRLGLHRQSLQRKMRKYPLFARKLEP
jgi:two-component system, response regulator RegA